MTLIHLDSWTLEHACCRKGYDNRSFSQALKNLRLKGLGEYQCQRKSLTAFLNLRNGQHFPNREKVVSDGQEEGRDEGPNDNTIFCSHASSAHPEKGKGREAVDGSDPQFY